MKGRNKKESKQYDFSPPFPPPFIRKRRGKDMEFLFFLIFFPSRWLSRKREKEERKSKTRKCLSLCPYKSRSLVAPKIYLW
jgi:hypothetical protein